MATRKKTETTAVATWDEELAAAAQAAAAMEEGTVTGAFFSIRAGVLTWQDSPVPGNQMAVIILDSVLENTYFESAFDSDAPQSPICFAFGRDEKELAPHEAVDADEGFQRQHEGCHGCPKNEFGTAETGRGKACQNRRRLAVISAGTLNPKTDEFTPVEDEDAIGSAALGFVKLPVLSVKGYAAYVKNLAGALRRPPFAMYTKVSVVPDAKSQFRVVFEALQEVPSELLPAIKRRVTEAQESIIFPYKPISAEEFEQAKPTGRGAGRGAKAQPPGRGRKY